MRMGTTSSAHWRSVTFSKQACSMTGHGLRGRALSRSLMRKMRFKAIVQKGVRAPAPSLACIQDAHLSHSLHVWAVTHTSGTCRGSR